MNSTLLFFFFLLFLFWLWSSTNYVMFQIILLQSTCCLITCHSTRPSSIWRRFDLVVIFLTFFSISFKFLQNSNKPANQKSTNCFLNQHSAVIHSLFNRGLFILFQFFLFCLLIFSSRRIRIQIGIVLVERFSLTDSSFDEFLDQVRGTIEFRSNILLLDFLARSLTRFRQHNQAFSVRDG